MPPVRRPRSDAKVKTTDEGEQPDPTPEPGPIRSGKKFSAANEKLRAQIAGVYEGIGALVMMGDAEYGIHILKNAEPISIAWVELAETNPKVKAFLVRFTTGGAAGQVIAMHIALLLPLAAKYNLMPAIPGMPGFTPSTEVPDFPPEGM